MRCYKAKKPKDHNLIVSNLLYRIDVEGNLCKKLLFGGEPKKEVYEWLIFNCGEFMSQWAVGRNRITRYHDFHNDNKATFYFKNKDDMIAFKLTWCS